MAESTVYIWKIERDYLYEAEGRVYYNNLKDWVRLSLRGRGPSVRFFFQKLVVIISTRPKAESPICIWKIGTDYLYEAEGRVDHNNLKDW